MAHADEAKAAIVPMVRELALTASAADVHLTIDAEEADRLELSMDMIEALVADDAIFANGWAASGSRSRPIRSAPCRCATGSSRGPPHGRKLMVRLVKGAYWDTEIKVAQVAGLTIIRSSRARSRPTSPISPAPSMLLGAPTSSIPPSPPTTPTPSARSRRWRAATPFEFQRLHGMGEELYEELGEAGARHRRAADPGAHLRAGRQPQGIARLSRPPPARKRRQFSSFVNRIADADIAGRRAGPRPGGRTRGA